MDRGRSSLQCFARHLPACSGVLDNYLFTACEQSVFDHGSLAAKPLDDDRPLQPSGLGLRRRPDIVHRRNSPRGVSQRSVHTILGPGHHRVHRQLRVHGLICDRW